MRFHHYIWDVDGTLFHSYPSMARWMALALLESGVRVPESEVLSRLKRSVSHATEYYSAAHSLDAALLLAEYRRQESRGERHPPALYPGMRELLEELSALGGVHYIYTHRGPSTFSFLAASHITHLFREVVTAQNGFPAKPSANALLYLLDTYNIPGETAVMIGDREIDLLCAERAGIAACLFDPEGFYRRLRCPLSASSVRRLRNLLLARRSAW